MTEADWRLAASLSMPVSAHLTGISRLQALGLEYGPVRPVRFVVEGELHLDLEGIFLHRTKLLPPVDEVGVTPAAAFIGYAARCRVIDGIKVGDWLLHHGHMTRDELRTLALSALWRNGAHEAMWLLEHLEPGARSLPESETRSLLEFAGLPQPEVNLTMHLSTGRTVIGDLVYRTWGAVVEYEGSHHQEDRDQYVTDIDRYAALRQLGIPYVQVTSEKLGQPRRMVGEVHRMLVSCGYDGPAPAFGHRWRLQFLPVTVANGPRRVRAVT